MLIIINGTLGVGKTWIARWLTTHLDRAAYIEGDTLGFVSDSLLNGLSRQQFGLEVGRDLIKAFVAQGAATIIYDALFIDSDTLQTFVSRSGMPFKIFYLTASNDQIASRIRKRGRPHLEKEILEASVVEKLQRDNLSNDWLGVEISTDGLESQSIVESIKQLI